MAKLKITLAKSTNSATKNHKATIKALGLRKIGQTVEHESNPALLGMLRLVAYLVKVEEA
jgi:large subunit ribosomal protein L30